MIFYEGELLTIWSENTQKWIIPVKFYIESNVKIRTNKLYEFYNKNIQKYVEKIATKKFGKVYFEDSQAHSLKQINKKDFDGIKEDKKNLIFKIKHNDTENKKRGLFEFHLFI